MSNEQTPIENQNPVVQPDAATTPIDLAQAFKMLNQADKEPAQEPVETGSVDEEGDGEGGISESDATAEDDVTTESGSDEGYDAGSVGGSSDIIDAIDFNAFKQNLLRDIQRNAANAIRKEFNEQNIGYYSAAELTVRDEQTGQVRFRNPDVQDERDPNYYFNSRSEMQQFIQAWNQGVDFEYRKAVNQKQQEMLLQEAPRAALIDFVPKFQAMDKATQDVFDALLEGHEVKNNRGETIGFNVNLDAVAAQAAKIAKNFNSKQSSNQTPNNQNDATVSSSEPALDAKTGNGKAADEKEPKNIGEALAMFDKKNKGGK